jgi:hypothetical protein
MEVSINASWIHSDVSDVKRLATQAVPDLGSAKTIKSIIAKEA